MRADRDHPWVERLTAAILLRSRPRREAARRDQEGDPLITEAEGKVLQLLAVGLTTDMAAVLLGLSHETVRTQVRTARYRLGAKNATHAVALALRAGVIR